MTAPLPPRRERGVATMADMGMGDMAGTRGVDETSIANMKMPAAKMKGMDPAQPATDAMPDMPGIKMAAAPALSGSAPNGGPVKHGPDTHGPGNSAVPMETKSRLDEPGTSLARIQSAMVVLFAGCAPLKAMEAEVRGRHSAVDSGDGEDCATRPGGKERLSDD